jgi:phosphatidate cytidylyltransferase
MKQRLIVAAVGVPLTAAAIWLLPTLWFGVLIYIMCIWCLRELIVLGVRKWLVWLTALLVLLGFGCLVTLRRFGGVPITFLVVGCAYIGDAGAMLTGKYIGKYVGGVHPFPKISPNKTLAGVIGGLVVPMLFALAFSGLIGWRNAVICGLVLGAAAECGDLFFSYVKRKLGVKDYGMILPGHGGLLDRFDSMIFVAPVAVALFNAFALPISI